MKNKKTSNLLLIDDDIDLLNLLSSYFRQRDFHVTAFDNAKEALHCLEDGENKIDVVVTDLMLPQMSGIDLIKYIHLIHKNLPIILMTGHGSLEVALQSVEAGAYDFVMKPLQIPQLLISIQRAIHLNKIQDENNKYKNFFDDKNFLGLKGVVGKSAGFKNAMDLARRVSSSQANIIISGESGTGKEVIAKAVHELGERKNGPFVAINCSAIPENLLESELFGYTKGAFTGAVGTKIGLFEEANDGTLFLDEIGDLALSLQAKLLRVLQERKIKRLGENQTRDITSRIICATHKDLKKEVEKGSFREDLYFRLNVIPIFMPPLRERKDDIVPLSHYFLKKFSALNGINIDGFTKEALVRLENLEWKGNVRELENTIERAVVLCNSHVIDECDLPLIENTIPTQRIEKAGQEGIFFSIDQEMTMDSLYRKYLQFIFAKNLFAKDQTAKDLGIDRKTLYRKLKEINLFPNIIQ